MAEEKCKVINLWTVARSLSTCLAYSFAQRDDTEFLDEPLQSHYISLNPPLRQALTAAGISPSRNGIENETDGQKLVEALLGPSKKKYRFCKNMAQYLTSSVRRDLLSQATNVILIRDPISTLASFTDVDAHAHHFATNWTPLAKLYTELVELQILPIVVDARDLQKDPEAVLRTLCHALDMDFQPAMLSWRSGQRESEPIASDMFYRAVRQTTGFLKPSPYPKRAFLGELSDLLEQSWPIYSMLKHLAIKPAETQLVTQPMCVNKTEFIWQDDQLVPAKFANVCFKEGHKVYEKLIVFRSRVLELQKHLLRLDASAKSMGFINIPDLEFIRKAIFSTIIINGMLDKSEVNVFLYRGACNCACSLHVTAQRISADSCEDFEKLDGESVPYTV